jgi:ribose transport system permease protein
MKRWCKKMSTRIEPAAGNKTISLLANFKSRFSQLSPFIGMILVMIFFEIVSGGNLLSSRNSFILVNEVFSIVLGTTGAIFLMAQGNLDFSMGAIVGIAGALGAIAGGKNAILILPVTLLAGLVVGSVNGFIYAKLNIPSFIATLGMSFILKGLTTVVLGSGAIGLPFVMSKYDNEPLKLTVLVIILTIGYMVFEYTQFGKQSRAIGALTEAARQCGVNITRTKFIAFMISGLVCGLVGFFSIVRACTASPDTGSGFEFNVLLALSIGGFSLSGGWSSKFRCVVVGSIIVAIISNGMTLWGIDQLLQQLVKGIIFIIAVAVSFDRKSVSIIK